jgi:hypothetical protein
MNLEFYISMHDIMNPLLGNGGSNIKLGLINTQGKIKFTDTNTNKIESIYFIILSNPNNNQNRK